MVKLIRILKNVTVLAFVLVLGLSYYELSDRTGPVTLYRAADGSSLGETDHQSIFYLASIFVLLVNVFTSLIAQRFRNFPFHKLAIPHQDFWTESAARKEKLQDVFIVWVHILGVILNIMVVIIITMIWLTNRGTGGQLYEYGLMGLLFILALLVWGGFIVYRLRLRREEFIT